MKRLKKFLPLFLIIMILFTGCGSASAGSDEAANTATGAAVALNAIVSSTSTIAVDPEFTDRESDPSYDDNTATHITLNGTEIQVSGDGASASGGVLTISSAGTYVISGKLSDGQIVVDAGDQDKVQLVLNGVTVNCSDNAPIYVKSADKVFITLNENTENSLTDGASYIQSDDNNVDGVIFSKADLAVGGSGTLNITANYKNAVVSKDDLVVTGGTFNITAKEDALNGKDCIKIKDGVFNISSSEGKGLTSKNDEDNTKGYVYIAGGTITIKNSVEGIEGTAIIVEDGTIDVTSSDDGFNAASGSAGTSESNTGGQGGKGAMENDTNCYLSIAGGTITVDASGDGLDSNGSMYISGGTIYVSGPTSNGDGGLDYNGTADISGGTLVVAGSAGMAQGFSETSSQCSLLYNFTSAASAGTEITLKDEAGNTVVSFTPGKDYQSVVISSPDLKEGATYTLTSGSQTADVELTGIATSAGATGLGMGGHGGPGKGGMGQPPQGDMGQPPQGGPGQSGTDSSAQ